MRKSFFKTLTVTVLAFVMASGIFLTACKKTETEVKAELWAKEAAVKVLQTTTYDSSYKRAAEYKIEAVKGEFEAAQIIITPEKAVKSYKLETADLKNANNTVLSKDNIIPYHQKYVEVSSLTSYNGNTGAGYYPDALLPFSIAEEYGENKIDAKKNQGIYIETFVPYEQEAGLYTGSFNLTLDGKVFQIPAQVFVYDYTISRDTHMKSQYIQGGTAPLVHGELNDTAGLNEVYFDELIRFRTSPYNSLDMDFVRSRINGETGLPSNLSTINVYVKRLDANGVIGINKAEFKSQVQTLIDASVEDNYDYIEKVAIYCGWIDEPEYNNTYDLVQAAMAAYNDYLPVLASEMETRLISKQSDDKYKDILTPAFKQKLIDGILKMQNYVATSVLTERMSNIRNHAPSQGNLNSAAKRYQYQIMEYDQWWYAVRNWVAMDSQLMRARLHDWQAFEYDFVGDMVWAVAYYKIPSQEFNDPYGDVRTNGDGYLFYPGKAYNQDKPISTLRIHAIRDSREEYEHLYYIREKYRAAGFDENSILNIIFRSVYSDLTTVSDSEVEQYYNARRALIQLAMLAEKGVFVTEAEIDKDTFKIKAESLEGVKIDKVNGAATSPVSQAPVSIKLDKSSNTLSFSTDAGLSLNVVVPGKRAVISTFETASEIVKAGNDTNIEIASAGTDNKFVQVSFGAGSYYRFDYNIGKKAFHQDLLGAEFKINLSGEEDILLELYIMGSGGKFLLQEYVLKPGDNTVLIRNIVYANWKNAKSFEKLRFEFAHLKEGSSTPFVIGFDDFVTVER